MILCLFSFCRVHVLSMLWSDIIPLDSGAKSAGLNTYCSLRGSFCVPESRSVASLGSTNHSKSALSLNINLWSILLPPDCKENIINDKMTTIKKYEHKIKRIKYYINDIKFLQYIWLLPIAYLWNGNNLSVLNIRLLHVHVGQPTNNCRNLPIFSELSSFYQCEDNLPSTTKTLSNSNCN